MKTRYITLAALAIAAALASGSCGKQDANKDHEAQETEAEITAAQMMGRNSAKELATREWRDTLQLQRHLLEMRSRQSKYVMENKPKSAAAFDSTFVSTIKTVRPDLYPHLQRHYK